MNFTFPDFIWLCNDVYHTAEFAISTIHSLVFHLLYVDWSDYQTADWQQNTESIALHEEHKLDSRLFPQQLAEGVDEQVEGKQAELDEQNQGVVACV